MASKRKYISVPRCPGKPPIPWPGGPSDRKGPATSQDGSGTATDLTAEVLTTLEKRFEDQGKTF